MGIETLMIGSMVASAGASILGGIGQSQQYGAQASQARYQAQVAENNKLIAEQNARYASAAGSANAQVQDWVTARTLGTARTAAAAGRVDVTQGSPMEVRESLRQMGRLQTLEEVQKSALDIYGYKAKATGFEAEAGLQTAKAASAERAAPTALMGSILGGAASVGDKWLRYQNVGGGWSPFEKV